MAYRKKTDDPDIQKLQKNIHAGHRQRMRHRLMAAGPSAFQDYELLEILLFYAIPRRNTNETAHMLIRRFGSLSAVLDASSQDLQAIPGIGPNAVRYIGIVSLLMERLTEQKDDTPIILNSAESVGNFVRDRLGGDPLPMFCVLFLDIDNTYVSMRCYRGSRFPSLRGLISDISSGKSAQMIIVECGRTWNPNDYVHLDYIRRIVSAFQNLEHPVWDYFILPDWNATPISLRRRGQFILMDTML